MARIYLRHDQCLKQRGTYSVEGAATIFAPLWVRESLEILGERLKGVKFEIYDGDKAVEGIEIDGFSNRGLNLLQKIARNEGSNVTGVINRTVYPGICDEVLFSLRDLVRQTVIVGVDKSKSCGGYGCGREGQEKQKVYVCDLAGLQFQQEYNTGRLVLVQRKGKEGILDGIIYENVVGEKRRSFEEVEEMWKKGEGRYVPHDGFGLAGRSSCYFDIKAYKRFVAMDVVLAGMALSEVADKKGDKLYFKFLKYGTGFFAGRFGEVVNKHVLAGVLDGLEDLFGRKANKTIKVVDLPFYKSDNESDTRIKEIEGKYGIEVLFSKQDALKNPKRNGLVLATTNCGDNHAVCGNEMGYMSVDAAIAENLKSKGNLLCPIINTKIGEQFLEI